MAFHFRGYLTGLSVLRGRTESPDVLSCLHRCKEWLDVPPADAQATGTVSSLSSCAADQLGIRAFLLPSDSMHSCWSCRSGTSEYGLEMFFQNLPYKLAILRARTKLLKAFHLGVCYRRPIGKWSNSCWSRTTRLSHYCYINFPLGRAFFHTI